MKVFNDLLNWQERTLTRDVWASFLRDCIPGFEMEDFSLCLIQKTKASLLLTLGIIVLDMASVK